MDIAFFRNHALTKGMSKAELERLDGLLTEQRFGSGEELCVEGAMPNGLYLVREGRLRVTKRGADGSSQDIATLEGPTVLGEMELVSGEASAATVVTDSDGVAYLLGTEAFERLVEEGDTVVAKIMRNIARVVVYRLTETNARIVELLEPEKKSEFETIAEALRASWTGP